MANQANQKSLVSKLAEAMNAVGGVEKKGKNEHYHYSYVKASDVAKEVRHELFSRGVILTVDEKEITEKEIMTNSGGKMNFLRLKTEYTLRDADSADVITVTAYGDAMDSGDKAIYKAKTGALKYFLRSIGIIPDEKEDPEHDGEVDDMTDERLAEKPNGKGKRGRTRIAEFQMRAWESACNKSGKTAQQKADFLRNRFDIAAVTDMAREDFDTAIKWAVGSDEVMAETLQASVVVARNRRPNAVVPGAEQCEAVAQGD